jgi:hypothetical protein
MGTSCVLPENLFPFPLNLFELLFDVKRPSDLKVYSCGSSALIRHLQGGGTRSGRQGEAEA